MKFITTRRHCSFSLKVVENHIIQNCNQNLPSGLGGCDEINAQIAPTSKGLRDGLNNEGIEFSMPLSLNKRRSSTNAASTSSSSFSAATSGGTAAEAAAALVDDDLEAEEEDLESTAASNWLESMGIDKSKFPTLNPQRVSLAQDNFKVVDGRPESLVEIEGQRRAHCSGLDSQ